MLACYYALFTVGMIALIMTPFTLMSKLCLIKYDMVVADYYCLTAFKLNSFNKCVSSLDGFYIN